MKYIKTEGNVTKTYEVIFDEEKLKELMASLDRNCYIRKVGVRTVEAKFEDEAAKKIKGMVNHANLPVNEAYKIDRLVEGPFWYHGLPLDAYYHAIYKDSVDLVKELDFILEHKDDEELNDRCLKALEKINNYELSDDFLSFDVRVEKANIKLTESLAKNDMSVVDAISNYASAVATARLNQNYDFYRLYELYQEVLTCIKYDLIEEVIKYNKTR